MVLIFPSQAGIDLKTKRKLFAGLERNDDGVGEQEVMGLKHFILPFSFLGIGILLSMVVWIIELSIKRIGQSSGAAVGVDEANVLDVDGGDGDVDIDNVDDVDVFDASNKGGIKKK